MNTEDPRVLIPNMMNQAQNGMQQFLDRFQQELGRMYTYIKHMDQNMVMMSVELMTARAHIQMIQGLLIYQGMYTEDQIEQIYKEKVAEPIKKHIKELQDMQRQQQAAAQTQEEPQAQEEEPVEETEEETNSDVVLPSEKHNVVKFK